MEIGNKYSIQQLKAHERRSKRKNLNFTGVLIAEYDSFYLFDCGRYRTTLHKGMLKCRDYAVEEVG